MKIGDRVIVTGKGAWAGFTGEYAGQEKTIIGILHRVNLDNGRATLRKIQDIKKLSGKDE
jgi:hypothetical protein